MRRVVILNTKSIANNLCYTMVLSVSLLLLLLSGVFTAANAADKPKMIKSKVKSGYCMQKSQRGWENGINIALMRCKDGADEMKAWVYDRKTGYIRSAVNPKKCIHKQSPDWDNGNNIHLWDCDTGKDENKIWIFERKSGYIRAASNRNKCLHKKYPDWKTGNNIHLWDCNGGPKKNKAWKLVAMKGPVIDLLKAESDGAAGSDGVTRYYIRNNHGLCLTLNVFDVKVSRKQKAKRVLKKAFDPREHAKNIAGVTGAFFLGPGGPEMVTSVRALRMKNKIEEAWKGDPKQGMGVTLLECGSVEPQYQKFIRDGRFLRNWSGSHCLKAKQGQAADNGGRVQLGKCKHQKRAAWYINEREFKNGKGQCLDVHRPDRTREGAKVQLWSCTGKSQQKWNLSY